MSAGTWLSPPHPPSGTVVPLGDLSPSEGERCGSAISSSPTRVVVLTRSAAAHTFPPPRGRGRPPAERRGPGEGVKAARTRKGFRPAPRTHLLFAPHLAPGILRRARGIS